MCPDKTGVSGEAATGRTAAGRTHTGMGRTLGDCTRAETAVLRRHTNSSKHLLHHKKLGSYMYVKNIILNM